MANEDSVSVQGVGSEYKDDRGGGNIIPSAVLGIVKNNIDPTRSGRIEVFLKRATSGQNQDDPSKWTAVRYLSPFFGSTPNTANPDGYGDFVGNPNSYGFWATPPDIGTEVVCVFLNGDPNEGYYIGSIPQPGMTHMTPGIAGSDSVIPNSGEAQSYGGAPRLPVSEINTADKKQSNNPVLTYQPRPVHSYQAAIYNKQGLLRDPDRGPISSSSTRESPSRVFGMSTPGRPIYQGGFDDSTIASKIGDNSIPDKSFQVIGRTGGHTLVMDDGDIIGRDQLMRFRTATGHTILMSDSAQTLFIIHANGQSYIELGKEGTIDMYSTNSVNIRTQGDLNLHADRDINMHATRNFNVSAENVQIESDKITNMSVGTDFAQHTKGNYTSKVDGAMSLASAGEASFASSGTTFINGPDAVNLNTGSAGLKPQTVKRLTKTQHTDTLYDATKGFAAAPGMLESITSRAPAHTPWDNANKGVDVKTNLSADANYPEPASPTVEKANNAAPASPPNPTNSTLIKTVPNTTAGGNIDKNNNAALTSSMATTAASNPTTAAATEQGAGTVQTNTNTTPVLGSYAMTPEQLEGAGYIKPGSSIAISKAMAEGKTLEQSIPDNVWTGKDGVKDLNGFVGNKNVQTNAASTLMDNSKQALVAKGIITGKESPTQTGGLVLAGATAGPDEVSNFIKTNAGVTNSLNAIASQLPPGILNSTAGSVATLIAAGNAAANLLDKSMSGLSGGSISGDNPMGVAKGLFDKITDSFKSLSAGKPQNLTAINAQNKAEQESGNAPSTDVSSASAAQASEISKATGSTLLPPNVSATLDKAFSAVASGNIPGLSGIESGTLAGLVGAAAGISKFARQIGNELPTTSPSGVSNLPGGLTSVSTTVQNGQSPSVPGTSDIKGTIAEVNNGSTGQLSSITGSLSSLKDKLGNNGNLAAFAGLGLSPNDLATLQGAISSVSAGGVEELKLPTTAEGTNDLSGLIAQSKALLGNDKIPPLNFGNIKPKELSPAETAEYNKLSSEKEALTDKGYALQKSYRDAQIKYGTTSPEAEKIWSQYEANQNNIEVVNQKMLNLSSGTSGSMQTNPTVPQPNPAPMPMPQMPEKPIMPTFPTPGGPISI